MHAVSACLDIGSDDYDKRATERSVEGLAESQGADRGYQAAPEVPAEPSLPVVTVALPSGDVLGPYRNALATHLQTYRRYPLLARTRHEQDTVRVRVLVRRNGQIDSVAIDQGSGPDRLDREALATLRRAEPLPPIPASVAGETMGLVFPLSFRLE